MNTLTAKQPHDLASSLLPGGLNDDGLIGLAGYLQTIGFLRGTAS